MRDLNNKRGYVLLADTDQVQVLRPPQPIPQFRYWCAAQFRQDWVDPLYVTHVPQAYVSISGHEVHCWTRRGSERTTVFRFPVRLPTNTRRGGQSANRLARLRGEVRDRLQHKIVERLTRAARQAGNWRWVFIGGHAERYQQVAHALRQQGGGVKVLGAAKLSSTRNLVVECETLAGTLDQDQQVHNEQAWVTQLETWLATDPDSLVFGKHELARHRTELAQVFLDCADGAWPEAVVMSRTRYPQRFGGAVGRRYFSAN